VDKLFEEYPINWVVNFAAESHVDNSIKDSTVFIQTNIAGTHVLLDVAKLAWGLDGLTKPDNKYRFLQISTDEVYGSLGPNDKSWVEDEPLLPNSPYAASKAASELLCRSYFKTYGLPVIISRSSNNFGPHQNLEKLIPTAIMAAILNEPIPIYGNGKNVRDWIYVYDNVNAIEIIILFGTPGEIYNIGGINEYSNIDLALTLLNHISDSKSKISYVQDRLGHDFRYAVNSSKLSKLGFAPNGDFLSNLKQTIDYYKGL
jgi:dTDP-glucose 4,6-dehydratase